MKTVILFSILILGVAIATPGFAFLDDDAVKISTYTGRDGKAYKNPRVQLIAVDEVRVFDDRGRSQVLSWKECNATIQFALRKQRDALLAKAEAKKESKQAVEEEGLAIVAGEVISVMNNGVIVACKERASYSPPAASLARVGGGGNVVVADVAEAAPRVRGTVFLRGVTGLADTETVSALARRTAETFRYTTASGGASTLRVYDYVPTEE